MGKILVHLADGFEEIEAIAPIDILRRGGCDVLTVSVMGRKEVTSSRGVTVLADVLFSEALYADADMLVLPGGMPGTKNLKEHKGLQAMLLQAYQTGKWIAAICAAPTILGGLGLLKGKKATCFPGMEDELTGAVVTGAFVEQDGKIITAKGAGVATDFGFRLLKYAKDEKTALDVKAKMQFP
ncbi:MAG TPA: DJ-1/PfpI family protein [Bacteroidales bacterium]|nr:DJ-1/PfpI family protein [Bacteroidales bacterium]HOK97779.1 DJ-1/PfpI family protein [Bacteroidales bacterium]HPO64725.1 DJ-1/PfpI family protein [Bacteroidales bacterium]